MCNRDGWQCNDPKRQRRTLWPWQAIGVTSCPSSCPLHTQWGACPWFSLFLAQLSSLGRTHALAPGLEAESHLTVSLWRIQDSCNLWAHCKIRWPPVACCQGSHQTPPFPRFPSNLYSERQKYDEGCFPCFFPKMEKWSTMVTGSEKKIQAKDPVPAGDQWAKSSHLWMILFNLK